MHTHTVYSDGTCSPAELVKSAVCAGLCCIGICDHDVVDGIAPAIDEGKKDGVEIIPAIELSADIDNGEVHILGYFIDYNSKEFSRRIEELRNARVERVFKICEKLRNLGMNVDAEEVLRFAGPGSAGRLHIARFMLREGFISTTAEAFRKYIGDNGPAYVNRFRISPPAAIKLITEAEGIPVVAHPYSLPDESLIEEYVAAGLRGIEVFYPEHPPSAVERYKSIAAKFNLLITGGSDFHGEAKETNLGSVKVPYNLVEELKRVKKEMTEKHAG